MGNQEKSCGAVIARNVGGKRQILLIKHVNGGHWAFPKGHMEKGETEEKTAVREILEETGLHATIDTTFRAVVTYAPKNGTMKDVVYFAATADDLNPTAQPEEVETALWVDIDKAAEIITFENDREVLEKYKKFCNK